MYSLLVQLITLLIALFLLPFITKVGEGQSPPGPPDAKTKFEMKKNPKYRKQNNNKETKNKPCKIEHPPPKKKCSFN